MRPRGTTIDHSQLTLCLGRALSWVGPSSSRLCHLYCPTPKMAFHLLNMRPKSKNWILCRHKPWPLVSIKGDTEGLAQLQIYSCNWRKALLWLHDGLLSPSAHPPASLAHKYYSTSPSTKSSSLSSPHTLTYVSCTQTLNLFLENLNQGSKSYLDFLLTQSLWIHGNSLEVGSNNNEGVETKRSMSLQDWICLQFEKEPTGLKALVPGSWAVTRDSVCHYRQQSLCQPHQSGNEALSIWPQGLAQGLTASPDRHHNSDQKGRKRTPYTMANRTVLKNMGSIPWGPIETVGQVKKEKKRI